MKVFVNLGTTSLATREDARSFVGVLWWMVSEFLVLAVVNWTLVGIFFFPAPFLSSPPCTYHEPGKQESQHQCREQESERERKFFFFLIMIFDIFMHPLRQQENEMEARSIFLLRLFYLFVNLARFLLRLRLYDTQIAPTSISSLSLSDSHCYISSVVLEQIERHFDVYAHDTIIAPSLFFRNSFGKRTPHSQHRNNECVVLEPSEMLVVSATRQL